MRENDNEQNNIKSNYLSLRKKLCKKSVNCGIIKITQEADF